MTEGTSLPAGPHLLEVVYGGNETTAPLVSDSVWVDWDDGLPVQVPGGTNSATKMKTTLARDVYDPALRDAILGAMGLGSGVAAGGVGTGGSGTNATGTASRTATASGDGTPASTSMDLPTVTNNDGHHYGKGPSHHTMGVIIGCSITAGVLVLVVGLAFLLRFARRTVRRKRTTAARQKVVCFLGGPSMLNEARCVDFDRLSDSMDSDAVVGSVRGLGSGVESGTGTIEEEEELGGEEGELEEEARLARTRRFTLSPQPDNDSSVSIRAGLAAAMADMDEEMADRATELPSYTVCAY